MELLAGVLCVVQQQLAGSELVSINILKTPHDADETLRPD